jgi:RNA recognition motif-containing protein
MKSIFVGNLPWSVKDEDLKTKFEEFGTVLSARIVSDKFTGRSRGFGFVDMEDADAEKAIAAMNGFEWEGRQITCNEARPKTEGSDRPPRRERRGGSSYAF